MASGDQTLDALRRYEDPQAGLFEEFAEQRLGPGRSLALVAGPLGERRRRAWAICPTVGPEHGNLRRLEALVARNLAAAGFEVLRIRPDADPLLGEISPSTRLAELEEGVELLLARGAESVGAAGAMFGGTLAALAAERLGLGALALVEPVVRGRQYARELLRREAVAHLHGPAGAGDGGVADELAASGRVSIRGLRLTKDVHDEIAALNVLEELRSFAGRSLLVGISPSGEPSTGLVKLRDRLLELGGDPTLAGIADPLHAPLGEYYYRDAGLLRIDTRLALDGKVAERLADWAREEAPVPSKA
jgi:hypothetical protein